MELGIIGFSTSGKTTIFNALTGGHAETTSFGRSGLEHNVAVVKVPDRRLDVLDTLVKPKRTVPAEVHYRDFGGFPADFGSTAGLGGQLLNAVGAVDALIHVVRAFENLAVPHPLGSIDPSRDIETMNLEMAYSDAGIIERRLERIANSLKSSRPAARAAAAREQGLMQELHAKLEAGTPAREVPLDPEQKQLLASFSLLTAKPLLVLLNIGDDRADQTAAVEQEYQRYRLLQTDVLAVCGKLEMELSPMEPAEAAELREGLGMAEPGRDRVIRASYALLGFQSFFTVGPDENRAWTIRRGELAPQAAGKIHTDLEKGFIRAETVSYEHLIADGGWNEARKAGHLRTEGRTYEVQDGDVMNILFSR